MASEVFFGTFSLYMLVIVWSFCPSITHIFTKHKLTFDVIQKGKIKREGEK